MREMGRNHAEVATLSIARQEKPVKKDLEQVFKKKCVTEFRNVAKIVSIGEYI